MSRYKKKKHNRILNAPKKRVKAPIKRKAVSDDEIIMTEAKTKAAKETDKIENTMHVVAGKKDQKLKKARLLAVFAACVLVIVIILQLILPAGIVQTVSNLTAVVGTGSYPISVSGSETLKVASFNNYYYHLTDTHISAYTSAGKILFSNAHGFEKPVLAASKGRVLVYNQGGNEAVIYDLKGEKHRISTENEIICADIANKGSYAITTYSDRYASAVTVYNKQNKVEYEWYSAEDTINNVAISATGKKIAVSTFNSSTGVFNSKVNIINFKAPTPEYTVSYENQIIYGLKTSNNSTLCVIKSNGMDYIKWSNYKAQNYSDEYNILYFRQNDNVNVGVFSRESDKTDNKIVLFTKSGRVKATVKYNGVINDIQVRGSNIYCINDSVLSALDFEGNIKYNTDYGYGGEGISVTSANVVAIITNNEIKRVKLQEKD